MLKPVASSVLLTAALLVPFGPPVGGADERGGVPDGTSDGISLVAVLPPMNLSGVTAPLREIRGSIDIQMQLMGIGTLPADVLDEFMAGHRMRYTGGLTEQLGRAFREEVNVDAVLVSSVDLYEESYPPKIAFSARLVSTGDRAEILWMDGVARAGNQSPGIFDLGLIRDPVELREKAIRDLRDSLGTFLSGLRTQNGRTTAQQTKTMESKGSRFRPKKFHRLPVTPVERDRPLRVAVLPFANDSVRRNAGEIMALHFVRHLVGVRGVEVIEQGVVRQTLLQSRLIMERGGLSFPQAELLRALLDVDLVFTGNVMDYQDLGGETGSPEVDFSVWAIDTRSRQIVWTSISHNRGDRGVYFFDCGRIYTAHTMASMMVGETLARVLWEDRRSARRGSS